MQTFLDIQFDEKFSRFDLSIASITTQNYWAFGLCLSSGILEIRKHNISETWSVSRLQVKGGRGDIY
jgi:hypothetical protein